MSRFSLFILSFMLAPPALSKDWGTNGHLYEITEPDLLKQITQKLIALEKKGTLAHHNRLFLEKAEKGVRRPKPVDGLTKTTKAGTYCAQKALGVCIRKKRQFCCFPSKLSRILHAQGRTQLSISWGTPENPDCRGFTADELSRLNFDRLDLGEIYTEISARVKQSTDTVIKRNLSDRIQKMTHGLKNKSPQAGM